MTDKEFRQLKRSELIDIIYEYQKQEEELRAEIKSLQEQLEDKNLKILEAGSIADAIVSISGILETTQKMADEYLASVRESGEQMKREYVHKIMKYEDKVQRILEYSEEKKSKGKIAE